MSEVRRESLEIMVDMLQAIRQQGFEQSRSADSISLNKRQLMRSANLNHKQMSRYLDILEEKSFISTEQTESGLRMQITDKGWEFLDRAQTITEFLVD